jgi:hypothetical protein
MTKVNTDKRVAVDQTYYWQRMDTCPLGAKVQLLTDGGVAIYGLISVHTREYFAGWAPLPNKPDWMRS